MHSALYAIVRPSVCLSDAFISPYGESMACRQRRRVSCSHHCSATVRNVQGWYEKSLVRRVRKIHGWNEKSMVRNVHGTKSPPMVRIVRGTKGTKNPRMERKIHGTKRPRYEKSTYGTNSLWYEKSGSPWKESSLFQSACMRVQVSEP